MHVRRALLLFAIVLGLAALAASVSRPPERRDGQENPPAQAPERGPEADAGPEPAGSPPELISFDASSARSRRVPAGRAAVVEVGVEEPGSVEIPLLGLDSPADPVTPARFDILPERPGRYEIVFTPAARETSTVAGALLVTSRK